MTVPAAPTQRSIAIDWMRGVVMVLMAIDHASVTFNAGRLADDSAAMYAAASPLPLAQFFTRFVTHVCAPTFVVLAGAAIALGLERKRGQGGERSIDRDLLIRGAVLIGLDAVYMTTLSGSTLLLQVLFALGAGMILMIPLRRLPTGWLVGAGAAWFVVGEAITVQFWRPPAAPEPMWTAPLFAVLREGGVVVLYPAIPWTAMMAAGWGLGRWIVHAQARGRSIPIRALLGIGAGALALFCVVRGLGGYGNMMLQRADGSLAQWLHVSKYPPSLAYAALELGLLAIGLAIVFAVERRASAVDHDGPLLVFGQTALFFYLLHFPLLGAAAMALGLFQQAGLGATYLAAAAVLVVMFPLCRWYRRVKRARPTSVLRFL